MAEKNEMDKAIEAVKHLEEAQERELVFLVMGRTGVGKSSTINSLLGGEVAAVGKHEPETEGVEKYSSSINDVNFVVVDTPGLCDDLESKGNDKTYIEKIKKEVSRIDCLLFVSELDATRITGDEKRSIQLITKAFGNQVWQHAIIVFTFSERVEIDEYEENLHVRTRLIREAIRDLTPTGTRYRNIDAVAISNEKEVTPNGKRWLNELYTAVFKRISKRALVPFYLGTASRLAKAKNNPKDDRDTASRAKSNRAGDIKLTGDNVNTIREIIEDDPILKIFRRIGSFVLGIFGLSGTVIGMGIEFIMDLFDD